MKIITYKDLKWIDIEKPTSEDIDYLKKNFNFHETIIEEIIPPSQRSKIEDFNDYVYFVIHFPVFDQTTKVSHNRELDIIASREFLITNHYLSIFPQKALFDKVNIYDDEKEKYFSRGIGFLLYSLIEKFLDSYFPKLDHIGEDIRNIEQMIFKGKESEMILEIARVKRNLLSFRQSLKPQKSILESLSQSAGKIFGEENKPYFKDLLGDYIKVWEVTENLDEILTILENTNNSLFSAKLNKIMAALTVISVIFLPPTFIANFLGMNITFPFDGTATPQYLLKIIITLMLLVTIGTILYFKKRKWL